MGGLMKFGSFSMREIWYIDWLDDNSPHLNKLFKGKKNYQRVLKHRIRKKIMKKTLYDLGFLAKLVKVDILTEKDIKEFDFYLSELAKKEINKMLKK